MSGLRSVSEDQQSKRDDIAALRSVVVESEELRMLEGHLRRFNTFRVLRIEETENRHSNVIAWLLNPAESHGLQESFLREFLQQVFREAPTELDQKDVHTLEPIEIDTRPFRTVEVLREVGTSSLKEELEAESQHEKRGRIDILVTITIAENEKWLLCIENKVNSVQGTDQLRLYRERVEGKFKEYYSKRIYLFLTKSDEEPLDTYYLRGNYRHVSGALDKCLDNHRPRIDNQVAVFLQHYQDVLRERVLRESEMFSLAQTIRDQHGDALDIVKKTKDSKAIREFTPKTVEFAQQIYARHRNALDFVLAQTTDIVNQLTEKVRKSLGSRKAELGIEIGKEAERSVPFFPSQWYAHLKGIDKSEQALSCEIRIDKKEVGDTVKVSALLKCFLGPSARVEWREGILNLQKEDRNRELFRSTYVPTNPPAQWHTFYQLELKIEDQELGTDNSRMASLAEAIAAECRRIVSEDRFRKMVEAVANAIGDGASSESK